MWPWQRSRPEKFMWPLGRNRSLQLQSYIARHALPHQWQHRPGPTPSWSYMPSLVTHIRLFLTTPESPVLPLFIVLRPSVSLSLVLIHYFLDPSNGVQGLWVSGVVSGVVLGVLCPAGTLWCQIRVISGMVCPSALHCAGLVSGYLPGFHLGLAPHPVHPSDPVQGLSDPSSLLSWTHDPRKGPSSLWLALCPRSLSSPAWQ